jgi:hypothetical protein
MKNVIFWYEMPCFSFKNRRFGGTHRSYHQGEKNQRTKIILAVPSSYLQEPHGVTFQTTVFFIVTAVKTSNFV